MYETFDYLCGMAIRIKSVRAFKILPTTKGNVLSDEVEVPSVMIKLGEYSTYCHISTYRAKIKKRLAKVHGHPVEVCFELA